MSDLAPIVLFVYNRLDHTIQTVNSLKNNFLADKSILYIYSDASKSKNDDESVKSVREYISNINGFKKIIIKKRNLNMGLADSIIDGVSKIVNDFGKIIVLEDDLVTSPYFLSYMNDGLNIYENEDKVACIHGYCYPIKSTSKHSFFIKGADCWGWATWKDSWGLFEVDSSKLLAEVQKTKSQRQIDFNNSYPYVKMLKNQINGKINSWAIRWYISTFLKQKLTLYPGISYVANIGMDDSGVHNGVSDKFDVELAKTYNQIKRINIEEDIEQRRLFEKYLKSLKFDLFNKIINKIKSYL
tara:strand:- start:1138 stop:2034 length:897 start_codon:yes stop_codon:yes gene_type:complete